MSDSYSSQKKQLKAKIKHHRKKLKKLENKLEDLKESERVIGFKYTKRDD